MLRPLFRRPDFSNTLVFCTEARLVSLFVAFYIVLEHSVHINLICIVDECFGVRKYPNCLKSRDVLERVQSAAMANRCAKNYLKKSSIIIQCAILC